MSRLHYLKKTVKQFAFAIEINGIVSMRRIIMYPKSSIRRASVLEYPSRTRSVRSCDPISGTHVGPLHGHKPRPASGYTGLPFSSFLIPPFDFGTFVEAKDRASSSREDLFRTTRQAAQTTNVGLSLYLLLIPVGEYPMSVPASVAAACT